MSSPPSGAEGRLRVAVTGSTGFIGEALVAALGRDGHRVHRVVRGAPAPEEVGWDVDGNRIEGEKLEGVDAVVHLAGENVGERWSAEKKRRIRESRVRGTRLLADALASLARPPRTLVSVSGVGFYGSGRGDELLTEESAPGSDFMAEVARAWEEATGPAARAGIRVAIPRLGLVVGAGGGALARMLPVFRMGGGGALGSGDQWWSWVALPDVVKAIRFLMGAGAPEGPVNVVAPEPVRNAEFTALLGRVLRRPTLLRVPAPALRLVFGEMADATLLASQRVVPARLLAEGFAFGYPTLEAALRSALDEPA